MKYRILKTVDEYGCTYYQAQRHLFWFIWISLCYRHLRIERAREDIFNHENPPRSGQWVVEEYTSETIRK